MQRKQRSRRRLTLVVVAAVAMVALLVAPGGRSGPQSADADSADLPSLGPVTLIDSFYNLPWFSPCELQAGGVGNVIADEFNAFDLNDATGDDLPSGFATANFSFNAPWIDAGSSLSVGLVELNFMHPANGMNCESDAIVGAVWGTLANGDTYSIDIRVQRVVDGVVIEPGADLTQVSLSNVNLTGANLAGANLGGVHLGNAILNGANLSGASMQNTNLGGASFIGANLSGANLANSFATSGPAFNLADLSSATMTSVSYGSPNFTSASLNGASIGGSSFISPTWNNTTCPSGVNSNDNGGTCP